MYKLLCNWIHHEDLYEFAIENYSKMNESPSKIINKLCRIIVKVNQFILKSKVNYISGASHNEKWLE